MSIQQNGELTPREHILMEAEKEQAQLNRDHAVRMKQLEIELKREEYQAKIQLKTLESKWGSWLKLPSLLIRLPLLILMGFAYCIAAARRYEPPRKFWDLLS